MPPLLVTRAAEEIYQCTIDATDTIELLEAVAASDEHSLHERWDRRAALGLHPRESSMDIELRAVGGHTPESPPFQLLGRILQQLFLAMNLSVPGSCNLLRCQYDEYPSADPAPPQLSPAILETAFMKARERQWPPLRALDVHQTWGWLHGAMLHDLDIAAEPADKALFTLLNICVPDTVDTDNILRIAQVFEGFFAEGRDNIGGILKQRLEAVLGEPPTHKRWFATFYELRSRIAHGSMPMLRPGHFYDMGESADVEKYIADFWEPVDRGAAALLGVLQDLITSQSRAYQLEQRVLRVPL